MLPGALGLFGLLGALGWAYKALAPRLGRASAAAGAAALTAAWGWLGALALSPWRALRPWPLACLWALAAALAWTAARRAPRPGWKGLLGSPGRVLAALFLLLTGLTAFFAAPNTYDSLSYHLPRVLAWAQQGSLAPYATHDLRQLYFAPLMEALGVHLYLLAGSDRLLSLLSWASYALSGGLAWAAARRLGGERAADLGLLACLSAGMSVAQATAVKNDLLSAALCAAAATLLWQAARRPNALAAALGGLALGLAALAKPSVYLFFAPWALALLWLALRQGRSAWKGLALAGLCFGSVQAPYWLQNLRLGAGPLGPHLGTRSESLAPRSVAASLLKQAALHLPPWQPGRDAAASSLDLALRFAGVDPVDARTTSYWRSERFGLPPAGANDSTAANWAVALLFLGLACSPGFWRGPACGPWALAAAGFVLFSALIKWQPWASRLHAPFFVLASLGLGLGLAAWPKAAGLGAALLLTAAALPALLHLEERPLFSSRSVLSVPRWDQYFRGRPPGLQPGVEALVAEIQAADCRRLAFSGGGDNPDYLVLEGLRRKGWAFEWRSTGVQNASAALEDQGYQACHSLDLTALAWGKP